MLQACDSQELDDDGTERAVLVIRRAIVLQPGVGLGLEQLQQRSREPRLADARLARHQHNPSLAAPSLGPAPTQYLELLIAANQRCRVCTAQGLEPIVDRARPQHLPGLRWRGHTDRVDGSKIATAEQIADQSPRRCVDHHRVRFGKYHQPTVCSVRLTDYPPLLWLARIGRFIDYDKPGRDTDTKAQCSTDLRCQLFDSGTQPQTSLDRLLGVIFVGRRMAEMNNRDVADLFADRPVATARSVGDASPICADHIGQILDVEGRGRWANKFAERDCELAPLRLPSRRQREMSEPTLGWGGACGPAHR